MPKLTVREFGKFLNPPITRQVVYDYIKRGELVTIGSKEDRNLRIDTDDPYNTAWLLGRIGKTQQPKPANTRTTAGPGVWLAGQPPPPGVNGDSPDEEILVENILQKLATLDLRQIHKAEVDKIKAIEATLKTRVERQHKRGELIERALIATVFGKLYQVDTNELRVLGATLAPEIAGSLGADDPEKVLAVEQMIDDRILRILGHIKRIMHDALVSWGHEGLVDATAVEGGA